MVLIFEREKKTIKKMCGSPRFKFIVKYFALLVVEVEDHQDFFLWRKGVRADNRKIAIKELSICGSVRPDLQPLQALSHLQDSKSRGQVLTQR